MSALDTLLPHRPPMRVIEEVVDASRDRCSARLSLRPEGLYFERGTFLPIWAAEIMAQGLAAGLALARGPQSGAFGYLVAVDQLALLDVERLKPGAEVRVEASVEVDIAPALECQARLAVGGAAACQARLRLLMGVPPLAPPTLRAEQGEPLRLAMAAGGVAEAVGRLGSDHPYLNGHFPGDPLLPAVGQLRLVEEALSLAQPDEPRIVAVERARFLNPVRPGAQIAVRVEEQAGPISFELRADGQTASRGRATVSGPGGRGTG